MAGIIVPTQHQTVTAASSAGYVTVTDSTKFYPKAFVWLSNTAGTSQVYCQVTDCPDSTHVGLRILTDPGTDPSQGQRAKGPNYGRSDVSAFNAGGFLDMEEQLIYITNADNSFSKTSP